nr:hypothetical protein [Tanacetum cinerariifolium]
MALTFGETHNMIAFPTKSDASGRFDQIIDFLNASAIKYALTVNPNIYVSVIKQFWSSVAVKKVNDVTRLQALVDRKKVLITEETVQEALYLDDADSIDCLPNEDIFTELARMGYEKPLTKLTFYKAFFSSQWKFLIHTILQCMSAKRTAWNKFSSSMASAIICLSTGRKFNFSKYIFDSLVSNMDSSSKFYMYPRFLQLMIRVQVGDLSSHTTKYSSPALTQKVFSNMRRVGKGFSRVETSLFESMIVAQQADDVADEGDAGVNVDDVPAANAEPTISSPPPTTQSPPNHKNKDNLPPHKRVENLEQDKISQSLEITKLKQRVKKLERRNKLKVSKLRRLKQVGTAQRVETSKDTIMDDVFKQGEIITNMDEDEDVTLKDVAAIEKDAESQLSLQKCAARRRKGVVIRDPEETATPSIIIHSEPKSKDKGKWIMVHKPKPLKRQTQIKQDEAYRKPQSEAQARKNMMIYLKNMAGFKMDYFKGMSYDVIRLIFKKYFNSNVAFLEQSKEQLEEEESRALKRRAESSEEKAAKNQKLDEEVEELRKHLQIILNDDDDVYTEATPLSLKRRLGARCPSSNLEDSKKCSWFSKGQELETIKVLWSADYNTHYNTVDLAGREKISINKVHSDQMLNNVRLEVEEESEVSLELLRFTRQQQQEGYTLE